MMKKDFFKVTTLSEEFEEYCNKFEMDQMKAVELRVWELQFQLAIAQQLTVIAGHLGTIVGKSKELKKNDTD